MVLARATSVLELGLRRLMRATARERWSLTLLGALLLIAAWGAPTAHGAEARLRVVATLPDLFVLTRAVAGDGTTVDLIARFGQNPHDMEVRPSQILMVRRADVLVRNGLEEDAWIDVMVNAAANPKVLRGSPNVVDASQGVHILKILTGRVDRSLGDVHPLGSPHYTLDPDNIAIVTANIAAGLARAAPESARAFEANRQALLEKVADADRRWKAALAPFRGAAIVSYHDSWPYFYRAFGLVEAGIVEDRPGIPADPRRCPLPRGRTPDRNTASCRGSSRSRLRGRARARISTGDRRRRPSRGAPGDWPRRRGLARAPSAAARPRCSR